MNNEITNILIVGVGGQGTLLTSRIVAQIAVDMGYDVKISEVHGMAQRGGSVVTQVRYGPKVYSPIISKGDADILLAFEKVEAARWLDYLKPDGLAVINDQRIDPLPVLSGKVAYPTDIAERIAQVIPRTIVINATDVAANCGDSRAANVVMVGLLTRAMQLPEDEGRIAVERTVPARALDTNLKAYAEGRKLMEESCMTGI